MSVHLPALNGTDVDLVTSSAPSRSKVGETVTWRCATCDQIVGTTWRDSDGLHAESTWQQRLDYHNEAGYGTAWVARDFSQSVTRARAHLTKRHQLQLLSERGALQLSTVIDDTPSGDVAKQEALPPAAIASTTATDLCATIAAQLHAVALSSYPDDLVQLDRDLLQIQALREIAKWANDQAVRKAERAARKPGATLTTVGKALGVSKQRVHQMLYPDGRY